VSRFADRYGARPVHLASYLAAFALTGAVITQIAGLDRPVRIAIWFAGAVIAHDLIAYPLYSGLDRLARRLRPARVPRDALNHLRIPAMLSMLLLVVWFPLIARRGEGSFATNTGVEQPDHLARWLAVSGALFAISVAAWVVRRGVR
jgi:hypothetical protein